MRHLLYAASFLVAASSSAAWAQAPDVDEEDGGDGSGFSIRVDDEGVKVRGRGHDRNDRVSVGSSVVVEAGETVGDAVAVGGTVTVRGKVLGDAVSVGGGVRLEDGAEVMGDAVSVGGGLEVAPSAQLHGNRVSVGGGLGDLIGGIASWGADPDWELWATIGLIVRAILLFFFGLLIIAFAPNRVARTGERMTQDPARSALMGLAAVVGFVPLCVLLAVTIVGLPAIPIMIVAYAALWVIAVAVLATWIGARLPPRRENKSSAGSLLVGMVVLTAIGFLPFGSLILFTLATVPAGAVLLSRFGDERFAPRPQ